MKKPIATLFNNTGLPLHSFPLLYAFLSIWNQCSDAFTQTRIHALGLDIALGLLTAFGRRTISRGICARANQFRDWSRYYRFFSKDQWSHLVLEHKLLAHVSRHLQKNAPLVAAVDDTHKKKTGRKIPGSGYFYDSKSPPFARSFAWQLRFLTLSVLLTPSGSNAAAKGILLRFKLAPVPVKPRAKADEQEKQRFKQISKIWTMTTQMIEQIHLLRCQMDAIPALARRLLVVCADSSYCNRTVIRNLPAQCILVSRTRKNLVLFKPDNTVSISRGRKKVYGTRLPTPEDIRKDSGYPWLSCTVFASGKRHTLRYKSVAPVLWKSAGPRHLRLVIIEPLAYRLRKNSKLLYRSPAYLLVSDTDYPVHCAIQHYFHRWEIEVNHRNAKTAFGAGDAQVRNARSVAREFSFAALMHSFLSVAALDAYGDGRSGKYVPQPKWRNDARARPSALDLVTRLRLELLMFETGGQVSGFSAGRGLTPNDAKYAEAASVWLAETVPKVISESFWSSILYADA